MIEETSDGDIDFEVNPTKKFRSMTASLKPKQKSKKDLLNLVCLQIKAHNVRYRQKIVIIRLMFYFGILVIYDTNILLLTVRNLQNKDDLEVHKH